MDPKTLHNPIIGPAYVGAISKIFTAYPVAFNPVIPTPIHKNIVAIRGLGAYPTARMKDPAVVQPKLILQNLLRKSVVVHS